MAKLDVEKITWSFVIACKNTFIFLKKTLLGFVLTSTALFSYKYQQLLQKIRF